MANNQPFVSVYSSQTIPLISFVFVKHLRIEVSEIEERFDIFSILFSSEEIKKILL